MWVTMLLLQDLEFRLQLSTRVCNGHKLEQLEPFISKTLFYFREELRVQNFCLTL